MTRSATAVLAITLVVAGCSDVAGEDGVAQPDVPAVTTMVEGTLTACVAPGPTVVASGDELQGYDVAVLEAVAEVLALSLETTTTGIDELVSGVALNSGLCDVGAGGVVARDALDDVVGTSQPYRTVHRQLVGVAPGPEVDVATEAGRIGYEEAGPAAAEVAALAAAEAVPFPSRADLARALEQGAVDLALVTVGDRARIEEQLGVQLALRGVVPTDEETVLLLPIDAPDDLAAALDEVLGQLRDDGTLDALTGTWLRD